MSDQNNPKISIIIPVYNTEKYLRECLDSVVDQTLRNIEIICINDGSTDSSPAILREYETKDGRIRIIDQKNAGVSAARNQGLELAKGKYILFVDSDDWIELTLCATSFVSAEREQADMTYFFLTTRHVLSELFKKRKLTKADFLTDGYVPSKLWSRIFLLKNNLRFRQEIRYLEDQVFTWDAVTSNPKIAFVPEVLYNYRLNPDSLTLKNTNVVKKIGLAFDAIEESLKQRQVFEQYSEIFYQQKILFFFYASFPFGWKHYEEKKYVKKIVQEILATIDFTKFDFATTYHISPAYNFSIHCFCCWLKGSSYFYGLLYYFLASLAVAKRKFSRAFIKK